MIATYRSGKRSFIVFDSDRVWLGRALIGESGGRVSEYPSILWTLARRYLWSRYPGSFLQLARSFCQPINDRWLPGGDLFESAKKKGSKNAVSAAAVNRRLWLRSLEWDQMPEAVQRAVLRFQAGTLPESAITRTAASTNWGSWSGIREKFPAGVSIGKSANWFFRDLAVRAISIGAAVANGSGSGALPLVLLAVFGAWWLSR